MTMQELCTELERMLQLPAGTVQSTSTLASLKHWDSLAAFEFIALADEKVGVSVSAAALARAKSVTDLVALLDGKVTA
jgi:acyl carrier protein